MEDLKIIMQEAQVEVEEKKSRFIANIFYVENIEEIGEKLRNIRKKYFDARHHCYAYRILQKDENNDGAILKEKQSDDGEPSGTAGAPMLNILQKNELINVLVIVTRYFGGTLLGTGGLVRAYSDATLRVISEVRVGKQQLGYTMKVVIEYKDLEKFKYYCRKHKISIVEIVYEKNIICTIELTREEKIGLLEENQREVLILENSVVEEKYIKTMIE